GLAHEGAVEIAPGVVALTKRIPLALDGRAAGPSFFMARERLAAQGARCADICDKGHGRGYEQQSQDRRSEGRDDRIPLAPPNRTLHWPDRPGDDRSAVEESAQILGEGLGRFVATRRFLGEAFEADRVEVARDGWLEALGWYGLGQLDLLERLEH